MIGRKITAIAFLVLVFGICALIFANAKDVGSALLIGYKDFLSEDDSAFSVVEAAVDSVDDRINRIVSGNTPFIDCNGAFQRLIGRWVIDDISSMRTIYRTMDEQITFDYPRYDVEKYVDNMAALNSFLAEQDTPLLYVQAPFKIDNYNPQLPRGIEDTTNPNADRLLQGLADYGVSCIDLREVIHVAGMDYPSLFFNTDHHWRVDTAFWAYTHVAGELEENYDIEIESDKFDPYNFTFTTFNHVFLGSQGRRVGKYFVGVDDFTLVQPAFDTDYCVKYIEEGKEYNGTFYDAILDKNRIESSSLPTNRYAAFFFGDHAKIEVINNNMDHGKILIVQDSFGLPFSAFMSLNFHQTDIIDLRYFNKQALVEYLKNNAYDMVIFIYNPSSFSNSAMFTFN